MFIMESNNAQLCAVCSIRETNRRTMYDRMPKCQDCIERIHNHLSIPNMVQKDGQVVEFESCINCVAYADETMPLCMNCWRIMGQCDPLNPNRPYWQNLSYQDVYYLIKQCRTSIHNRNP